MTSPPAAARPRRNHVRIDASVTRACGNSEKVSVEDLSLDGCAVRGWFQPGERLTLTLPRIGSFAADVRWASRGRAGLRFDRRAAR